MRRLARCLIVICLLMQGCASSSSGPGGGAAADGLPGGVSWLPSVADPLETLNRGMYVGNDWLISYVVDPLLVGYRFVVPKAVRGAVSNLFTNALYPGRLVNNLLQGKAGAAWDETRRFGVNTTVGVLGLFDVASDWQLERSQEDLGQTLARWGWRDSSYFVLPFFGPSSVRDAVGFVGDTLIDPAFYYSPASTVRIVNRLADEVRGLLDLMNSQYDDYELTRLLYVEARQAQVDDLLPREGAEQAVRAAPFLAPSDLGFGLTAETGSVLLPVRGQSLPYNLWCQPGSAPLVVVLPDFGGYRSDGRAVALAELLWQQGCSVVSVSDTWNWECARAVLAADQPGDLLRDALDLERALERVLEDVTRRFPGRVTEHDLVGLGHGALLTLVIAAEEADPEGRRVGWRRCVAVHPALDVARAVAVQDGLLDALVALPPAEAAQRVAEVYGKAVQFDDGRLRLSAEQPVPFAVDEASVVAGLAFRNTLRDLVVQTQRRRDLGVLPPEVLADEQRLQQAAATFDGAAYLQFFVVPSVLGNRAGEALEPGTAARWMAKNGLAPVAALLAANPATRCITSPEDAQLDASQRDWLVERLGAERVVVREGRGFLGRLDRAALAEALVLALR